MTKQVVKRIFDKRPHRRGAPQNYPFPSGGCVPPSNTWFLGTIRVHTPNGISIGSAVLAQLMVMSNRQTQTDRHTDRHADRHADHGTSVTVFALRCAIRPKKKEQRITRWNPQLVVVVVFVTMMSSLSVDI